MISLTIKVLLERDLTLRRAIFRRFADKLENLDFGSESTHSLAGLIIVGLHVLGEGVETWIKSCRGLYQREKAINWTKFVVNCFIPFLLGCTPSILYRLEFVQK